MDRLPWYPGFEMYQFFMEKRKLPVHFTHAAIEDDEWGFITIYADIDQGFLPRSHRSRGFPLHLTLGHAKVLKDEHGVPWDTTRELVEILNKRYAGKQFSILLDRIGGGGAACFDQGDPICLDPIIDFIYQRGGSGWKEELHISL